MRGVKQISILLAFLVICSLFIPLSINYTAQNKITTSDKLGRYIYLSRLERVPSNKLIFVDKSDIGFEMAYNLGIKEGVSNGVVVLGNFVRNTAVGTIFDYLDGFNGKTSEVKMVWLFFGIFIEFAKNVLLSLFDLAIVFIILLFQSTDAYLYIISYALTILLVVGMIGVFRK